VSHLQANFIPTQPPTNANTNSNHTLMHRYAPKQDPDVVRAWITTSGITLCVDRRFTDWLGTSQGECVGRPFAALSEEGRRVEE